MHEHAGVMFFVRARHKVEHGRRGGTEDECLALVESRVYAVLEDVVIGKVLESSVVDFIVATFVVDLIATVTVDRNALDVTEADFFAGL